MNMVADASALLAVLLAEDDADQYLSRLLVARTVWVSPKSGWWEVQVRMCSRFGPAGEAGAVQWMTQIGVVVEAVAPASEIALAAYTIPGAPGEAKHGRLLCLCAGAGEGRAAPL